MSTRVYRPIGDVRESGYLVHMGLSATRIPSRPPSEIAPPSRRFAEIFSDTCARSAEDTAIVDGSTRLTFSRWATLTDGLASSLADRGVGPGDTVAFQLPNWWETAVIFTAIARLGAIANPLLPTFRERELLFILRGSGARHVFVPAHHRGTNYLELIDQVRRQGAPIEHVYPVRARGTDVFSAMAGFTSRPPTVGGDPDDLLLLMYTSGTTADPKGVLHTNATLVAEIESLARAHALTADDSTLMPSPLTHISGVLHGIMGPAMLATRAILMARWDPREATEQIEREAVSYMVGAPVFLQEMLATPGDREWARSLRLFSCGGASVSPALMRTARDELGCVAKRVYGSTEFPTVTTTEPEDSTTKAIETEGKPIAPNQVRVIGVDGEPVVPGQPGEVQARGPECFVGYVDPRMNEDAFTTDGWFRTGDIGSVDPGGYLTITGRIKEIVIRKGEKISIREVEDLLLTHPAIHAASVVGISDPQVGERLCAALQLEAGAELSAEEATDFLRASGLAVHKLPERFAFKASLPRTESGKIHRARVAEVFEKSAGAGRD